MKHSGNRNGSGHGQPDRYRNSGYNHAYDNNNYNSRQGNRGSSYDDNGDNSSYSSRNSGRGYYGDDNQFDNPHKGVKGMDYENDNGGYDDYNDYGRHHRHEVYDNNDGQRGYSSYHMGYGHGYEHGRQSMRKNGNTGASRNEYDNDLQVSSNRLGSDYDSRSNDKRRYSQNPGRDRDEQRGDDHNSYSRNRGQGFASMDEDRHREVSSKGGRHSHDRSNGGNNDSYSSGRNSGRGYEAGDDEWYSQRPDMHTQDGRGNGSYERRSGNTGGYGSSRWRQTQEDFRSHTL